MNVKNSRYLIFDFDGTLVDSFRAVIEKFNFLAQQFSFRKVDDLEIDGLRDLTSKELIKFFKIPLYKLPSILFEARKQMRGEMQILSPFVDLPEALQQLYDRKFTLGILTSNSAENVIEWLQRNRMQHLFDFIHAESNFFGKKQVLRKILKLYKMDKAQTFYVGDETRDIEAAKKCGVRSVAVTWGFNSEKALSHQHPDYIARNPEDILTILNQIKVTYENPSNF